MLPQIIFGAIFQCPMHTLRLLTCPAHIFATQHIFKHSVREVLIVPSSTPTIQFSNTKHFLLRNHELPQRKRSPVGKCTIPPKEHRMSQARRRRSHQPTKHMTTATTNDERQRTANEQTANEQTNEQTNKRTNERTNERTNCGCCTLMHERARLRPVQTLYITVRPFIVCCARKVQFRRTNVVRRWFV